MFRLVLIEREYGAGAACIAKTLAERLGWKLWDRALTEEFAKEAHVSLPDIEQCCERLDSPLYRLAKVFLRGSFERGIPTGTIDPLDADRVFDVSRNVLERIAERGNAVVVGRGAPYFLRHRHDAFCVFCYADREEKLRRLLAAGMDREHAEHSVDTVDRERFAFVKHYFHTECPTRSLYHLMINTGMGDDVVVDTIVGTMEKLQTTPLSERVAI
jgi:cytidylate kinase